GQQMLLTADDGTGAGQVSAFIAHRTRAIIMAGSRRQEIDAGLVTELERYQLNGGKVVTIGQAWLDGASAVTIDNYNAGIVLAETFIQEGHRRFVFLAGPDEIVTAADRRDGFSMALEREGLVPEVSASHEFSTPGGYEGATALVESRGFEGLRGLVV